MSDSRAGRIDPIAAGLADAGASGFRALEAVAEGLADAVSMRSAARGGGTGAGATGPAAGALAGDLLRVLADLLDRAGGVAHAVADAFTQPEPPPPGPPGSLEPAPARLVVTAPAGEPASGTFTYWNTGTVTLTGVRFECTDLVAGGARIANGDVTFAPPSVERLAPGEGATVVVTVAGRPGRIAGDYHGVLTGEPGAGAVLLTARNTPKR
jgi:hypothetical protein